jgi:protein phosphatase
VSEQTGATQGHRIHFIASGRTDVGRKRPHNEDSIAVDESIGLFAVADGMGGHAAGEVASRTAVETLHEFIAYTIADRDFTWPFGQDQRYGVSENILLTGVQLANRKICQMATENRDYSGMGTTLAVLYAAEDKLHICHVGDSRVYRFHEGALEQITMDHSWVNEQLQRNIITEDEARNHRWRNVITRALGNRPELEVDLKSLEALPGDLFALCSDGLTGMLRDEEITNILSQYGDDLKGACDALIEAGNEAGGMDNISVILVRILP